MTELGHMKNPMDSVTRFLKYHQSQAGKDIYDVSISGLRIEEQSL